MSPCPLSTYLGVSSTQSRRSRQRITTLPRPWRGSVICQFIDEHRDRFGVVVICRALAVHGVQIAPRTYWAHRSSAPSKRALWDTTITEILPGIYERARF